MSEITISIESPPAYCPWDGSYSERHHPGWSIDDYRKASIENGKPWYYDPYSGERRPPGDVACDPYGRLIDSPKIVNIPKGVGVSISSTLDNWRPFLKDRGDGVAGHYCIARHNPDKRCHEYWTPGKGWGSVGAVYRFDEVSISNHQGDVRFWRNDAIRAAADIAQQHGYKEVHDDIMALLDCP